MYWLRVSCFGLVFFFTVISKPGIKDNLKPGNVHQLQTEIVSKETFSLWPEEHVMKILRDRKRRNFQFLFVCFVFVPSHLDP